MTGSSPRVRGKPRRQPGDHPHPGLIPARAGKTTSDEYQSDAERAHPRACGENRCGRRRLARSWGSSPRVRGKPERPDQGRRGRGLIPARAGKTARHWRGGAGVPAHPRACGENMYGSPMSGDTRGSSPRVRGKPPHPLAHAHPRGLIPARAGKTRWRGLRTRIGPAHPRVCGENLDLADPASFPLGSSPRVRGKPGGGGPAGPPPGLIPACAGKTYTCPLSGHLA